MRLPYFNRFSTLLFIQQLILASSIFAQGISLTPSSPAVNVGGSITINADRPVKFSFYGYGSLSSQTSTSVVFNAVSSGAYPQHLWNGCMVGPNDSVFNMVVNKLPVDANSAAWTPFILSNGMTMGYKWGLNLVDSSTPMAPQQFADTPQLNGVSFPNIPQTSLKRQNGAYTTDARVDHHILSLNTQTCQFYETNQQGIASSQCPTCTADRGWTYASTSYALPAVGSGSAARSGLPLAALTVHISEIRAGHISHALRFTACSACVSPDFRWPATASNGQQSGAPPIGTRFRLKSSFSTAGFPTAAQRILVALQQYGMILAGPGPDGEIALSTDVTQDPSTMQALQSLTGGVLNASNFEVVDESSYMLSPTSSVVNPRNVYSNPVSFALLTVTDAANSKNVVNLPIAVQPPMVGTPEPTITVQAGTPAFQVPNWVTGSSNQSVTWSISPSNGSAGTVSSTGIYTPPAAVSSLQSATLTLTSAANTIPYATTSVVVKVIPAGAIRIDAGSSVSTVDDRGLTWLADMASESGNYTVVSDASASNAWSNTINHAIWQTYKYTAGDDIFYKFRVPNGSYAVQMMLGVGECSGSFAGQPTSNGLSWGPLNLQSQASIVNANWDFSLPIQDQCQTPETSSMLAQVTDNTLTVAVRATGGDGQHTAPLLNGLTITPVGSSAASNSSFTQASNPNATPTVAIQDLDSNCGQPGYNCRAAFQNAFNMFAAAGGGTLTLPAGTYFVDFPELAQNVTSAPWFTAGSLIAVPPNTTIQGHLNATGVPDSVIQWQSTSAPIFTFAKASNSSMKNLRVTFVGTTATNFPYGDVVLLRALGYNATYPHQNTMSGGNYEMFTFAMVFDSDNTLFNNITFDSATRDNNHVTGSVINVKGKGVVLGGGGGLTALANGNQISNILISNYLNGFTVSGQNAFTMSNISGDWRGSNAGGGPGHLIYTTDTYDIDPNGNLIAIIPSTNVTLQNISEGPNTFDNTNAGGTLAIKCINGGVVNNITSQHPVGLIQTLYEDVNVTFSNMTWSSNYDLCANYPNNCAGPIIYSTGSSSQAFPIQNLTFNNVNLTSTVTPISVLLMGDGLTVNGMNIKTPPIFLPNQVAKTAVLGLKATAQANVTNFTYTPLITSFDPNGNYNNPLVGWNPTSNVTAQVNINWPSSIPVPTGKSIISSGFQTANNNKLSTRPYCPTRAWLKVGRGSLSQKRKGRRPISISTHANRSAADWHHRINEPIENTWKQRSEDHRHRIWSLGDRRPGLAVFLG